MSTLKVTNLQHPSAASANVTLDASGNADFNGKNLAGVASVNGSQLGGNRNMLYNGAHTVAQRATQATGVTSTGFYTTDRWEYNTTGEETVTLEQSTDAPDGFGYSHKLTVTTADSDLIGSDYGRFIQELEGQDCQNLAFGTSNAKTTTLSFWVKSSVTGDYAILYQNVDAARMITKTYTINSANTWEYKTLTFVGDTSGSITSDNTSGLRVFFWLSAGSDWTSTDGGDAWSANDSTAYAYGQTANVIGTLNATWQFTGIQLEAGSTATDFEHESVGTTLQKCQRYYHEISQYTGAGQYTFTIGAVGGSNTHFCINNPQPMRSAPTITYSGTINMFAASSSVNGPSSFAAYSGTTINRIQWASTGLTSGYAAWADIDDAKLTFDAEL